MQKRRLSSKIKLTVYVSRSVADRMDLACKDPSKNKSKLTEKALDLLLDPERDLSRDGGFQRRLDQITRQVTLINRHQQVVLESVGLFIRYFLTVTPPLPKFEHEAASAKGHQRFEAFIAQLGKRIAGSQTLVSEVLEKISTHDPDLLTRDLDEQITDGFVIHQHASANSSSQSSSRTSSGPAGPGRGGEAPAQQGARATHRPPGVAPGASAPKTETYSGEDNG